MNRWNIQYLKQLYDKYYYLSVNESDQYKALEYENTANSILDIIERYDELSSKTRLHLPTISITSFKDVIDSDLQVVKKYGYYCPYIREINDYNELLTIHPEQKLQRINFNSSKIISVSNSFFKQFKGIFYDTYSEMKNNFDKTIHFHKLNNRITNSGQTYSVYNTPISFFEMGVNSTVQDYVSSIHEFGHGISCSINPQAMWDYEKYCFIEVDSLFFEILGTDYVGKKIHSEKDCFNINIQVLKDYLYSAQLICTKLDMYNSLSKKDLSSKKNIIEYLKNDANYNKLGIKDTLNTYIREYFHYIISYLTAIELYFIYQEEPDVALDILFQIIINKKNTNIEYLEFVKSLGLEPGKNFDKYIKKLYDKAKEFSDEKSIQYKNK